MRQRTQLHHDHSRRRRGATLPLVGAILLLLPLLAGCGRVAGGQSQGGNGPLKAVATTTMITDLVQQIGGERVQVTGLMGAGVDPHLYKASQRDVSTLDGADVIFYNGLFLEGKIGDVLEKVGKTKPVVQVTAAIPQDRLLASEDYADQFDPHVWFDVSLWRYTIDPVVEQLSRLDPEGASYYRGRGDDYQRQLDELDAYVERRIAEVPPGQRALVTAHDAFNYFGRRYGLEVRGLQGISTEVEAGSRDVQEITAFLAERRIKAIFVESSVPRRNIEAVQAASRARGWEVAIGGELYSDALGEPGTPAGTYTGTVRANVDLIVEALK